MKRTIYSFAVVAILMLTTTYLVATAQSTQLSPSATPTVPLTPIGIAIVNINALNVRSGPTTDNDIVGVVRRGGRLDILKWNSDQTWLLICCVDGKQGWVFGQLVRIEVIPTPRSSDTATLTPTLTPSPTRTPTATSTITPDTSMLPLSHSVPITITLPLSADGWQVISIPLWLTVTIMDGTGTITTSVDIQSVGLPFIAMITPTWTPSATSMPTATPTNTDTPTPAVTPTPAETSTPMSTPTATLSPTPTSPPVEVLSNHSHFVDDWLIMHIVGEVQNNRVAGYIGVVGVTANLFNTDGQLVDTDTGYITLNTLGQGDKTCFDIMLVSPPDDWSYYEFEPPRYRAGGQAPPALTILDDSGSVNQFGWYELLGLIRNDSERSLEFVKAVGTLYDAGGTVLGCNFSYVSIDPLAPGKLSSFKMAYYEGRDYSQVDSYRIQADGGRPSYAFTQPPSGQGATVARLWQRIRSFFIGDPPPEG